MEGPQRWHRALIWLLFAFYLGGCGIGQQIGHGSFFKHPKTYHINSCGVVAIYKFRTQQGEIGLTKEAISYDIQIHQELLGGFVRNSGGIVTTIAYDISLPSEIIDALHRAGYACRVKRGKDKDLRLLIGALSDLGVGGIALSRDRTELLNYHYEAFPPEDSVGRLYGRDNEIILLIIAEKAHEKENTFMGR